MRKEKCWNKGEKERERLKIRSNQIKMRKKNGRKEKERI